MIKSTEEALRLGASTQWKKGQTGNPLGKPKKLPELDKLLSDVLGEEKDGIEAAKAILMALRQKAIKGDTRAAEMLLDRAYGKAKQFINLEGTVENIQIIRIPDNNRDNIHRSPEGLPGNSAE